MSKAQETPVMSKAEVERFAKLLKAWHMGEAGSQDALLAFLAMYRIPLVNALQFYSCDK